MRIKLKDGLIKVALFFGGVVLALFVAEGMLAAFDPASRLPVDGKLGDQLFTWGHRVENNSFGFREREIPEKADNTPRVMVLGDSLTWGVGLSAEERFTSLTEKILKQSTGFERSQVLNFGAPAASTVSEARVLEKFVKTISPDVIVVGFCVNDTQTNGPNQQDWSVERVEMEARLETYFNFARGLSQFGLKKTGELLRRGAFALLERLNIVPVWTVALDRTYQPESPEWNAFSKALSDIEKIARQTTSKPPIFLVLNSSPLDGGTVRSYKVSGDSIVHTWNEKAEKEAVRQGFLSLNVRSRIEQLPPNTSLVVNELDGHPSARLNQLYAEALAEKIIEIIRVR